jgi:hypothetical protein
MQKRPAHVQNMPSKENLTNSNGNNKIIDDEKRIDNEKGIDNEKRIDSDNNIKYDNSREWHVLN